MVRELIKCDTFEKRIIMMLGALFIGGLLCYGYFVNQTIMHVVARRSLERSIDTLSSDVADLSLVYIDLKNGVTLEDAYARGFVEGAPISYVARGQFALGE